MRREFGRGAKVAARVLIPAADAFVPHAPQPPHWVSAGFAAAAAAARATW